jgi:hypothetical protein
MVVMLLIYLVILGLSAWFGPKVIAVLDNCDANAEVTNVHALAGFMIGVIPVVNIFFVFFGGWILAELYKVLEEERKGVKGSVDAFNRGLKELEKMSGK